MFSNKAQIPCMGISFGVDRIFSITNSRMEQEKTVEKLRGNEVDVFVMAFSGTGFTGLLKERMEVCRRLWEASVKVSLLSVLHLILPNFALLASLVNDTKLRLYRLNSPTNSNLNFLRHLRQRKPATSHSRPAKSASEKWA